MEYKLDDDMMTNDVEYFYSLHGLRFESMNRAMAASLDKKFGKEFRAISILNAWPSRKFDVPNYIIINQEGYRLAEDAGKPVVLLVDYEDVNQEFAADDFIHEITTKLLAKQQTVFVFPFTSSFLDLPSDRYTVIGPKSSVAQQFDSKVNQMRLFQQLNLPCVEANIYDSEQSLIEDQNAAIPCYLSADYTSGGSESGLIQSTDDLQRFLDRIRPINMAGSFIAAEIFETIAFAPNVTAIVTADGNIYELVVTDQILDGNRYLGNTYPSLANAAQLEQIHSIMQTIGKHLFGQGYLGLFGCDFMIGESGRLVVVDLNPRHQGGYACNGLALNCKGLSLSDIELASILGEPIALVQKELDTPLDFAWGHSKLYAAKGQIINDELQQGNIEMPFEVTGQSYVEEFYKKGSVVVGGYVGYHVLSAADVDDLEPALSASKEMFDQSALETRTN